MATPPKFSKFLAEFGGVALDDELTAALSEVADAVYMQETGGTVTLKLKLAVPKGTTGGLIVSADVDLVWQLIDPAITEAAGSPT